MVFVLTLYSEQLYASMYMQNITMGSFMIIMFLCYVFNGFEAASGVTSTSDEPTGACDTKTLSNCTKSVLALFDVTKPGQIDMEAMFNFSCGPDIDDIIHCIETRVKPYCTNTSNSDPLTYKVVHNFLPQMNNTKVHCNDRETYLEMMTCAQGFLKLQPFLDCAQGTTLNKTMKTTDLCSTLSTINACSYKYVGLACPKFKKLFLETAKKQGCADNIENAQEVTSCDADMHEACPTNSAKDFKYVCSAEGKAARVCIDKVRNLCGNKSSSILEILDFLPSVEVTERMCSDGTGYRDFGVCYEKFSEASNFKDCMKTNSTTKLSICEIMQKSYDCTVVGITTHCPELNTFFHRYYLYTYRSNTCTLDLKGVSAAVPTSIVSCFLTLVSCYLTFMFTI